MLDTGGVDILVVDDDDEIRDALCAMLGDEGYSVASATNGALGLEYLRANAPPRLVILDIMMPLVSGIELREEQLRDPRIADVPIILMTMASETRRLGARLGAASTFEKPPKPKEVLAAVARVWADHTPRT